MSTEIRFVRSVLAAVRSFADMMSARFLERAAPHLREGEELPTGFVSLLQRVVARMIESARDRLVAAEKAHRDALRAESQIRARRDKAAAELYKALLKARKTFEAFGPGKSTRYLGLEPGFGDADPQVLVRHARESVGILSDPDFRLEDVDALSVGTLSAQEHVEEIRPVMERVEAILDELEIQKRWTSEAVKVKTQALDTFRTVFVYGSRFEEALYVLAGEKYHAARLRPKVGRSGSTDADLLLPDPDPGDAEPTPDDPGDDTPPSDGGGTLPPVSSEDPPPPAGDPADSPPG